MTEEKMKYIHQEEKRLNTLVKTIHKSTKLSELLKMDRENPGILHKFWRKYSKEPNFVHWYASMEKLEPNYKEAIKNLPPKKDCFTGMKKSGITLIDDDGLTRDTVLKNALQKHTVSVVLMT